MQEIWDIYDIEPIKDAFENIEKISNNLSKAKSIYIYGDGSIGKTHVVKTLLKQLEIDFLYFDINNAKDRTLFNELFDNNTGNINIFDCFQKRNKKMIYIIDNLDHIQNNEKAFIGNIIKLIRIKKKIPISKQPQYKSLIFIGTNTHEKRIKELMNISICHELKINKIDNLHKHVENHLSENYGNIPIKNIEKFHNSYKRDIKKLMVLFDIFQKSNNAEFSLYDKYHQNSKYSDNINITTKQILQHSTADNDEILENMKIHDNDRTTVTLMYHENIIHLLNTNLDGINTYIKFLKNITFGDYIDRIAFQKQIWIFNEMTYYLKVKKNIELLRESPQHSKNKCPETFEPIFTKVLTKYSTEYNNNNFVIELCKRFNMTRKELYHEIHIENEELLKLLTKVELNRLKNIIGLSTK